MGLRFRKSIRLGKYFRINLSSKGAGYSTGVKGIRYTKTATGKEYITYSIPGTGISYRESLSDSKSKNNKVKKITSQKASDFAQSEIFQKRIEILQKRNGSMEFPI